MSKPLDGHLVGFDAMPDLEGATPGWVEEEFTDIYGNELIPQKIGDGAEAYEKEVDKHTKAKKINFQPKTAVVLVSPLTYER